MVHSLQQDRNNVFRLLIEKGKIIFYNWDDTGKLLFYYCQYKHIPLDISYNESICIQFFSKILTQLSEL